MYSLQELLVRVFRDAGVPMLAGTDAPATAAAVPGFSMHEELRNMVAAGLTPYEALRAATANPAEFLGATAEFGTVAVGRRADLILLDGNPLKDIGNTAGLAGVMIRGRWLPRSELQTMLDDLAAANKRDPAWGKAPESKSPADRE